MDPDAALRNVIVEYQRGNYAEANVCAENLHRWVNQGGFLPDLAALTTLQQQVLISMLSDGTSMAQVAHTVATTQ